MLSKAGMGVAMGNAEPAVLEQTSWHTLTNAQDGVAAMIRRVLAE